MDNPRSSIPLAQSAEYSAFRSTVPLRKVVVDSEEPDKVRLMLACHGARR